MARAMAKRFKQRSGLESAKGARAPPRGTWSQPTGGASARDAWHYTNRKNIWRSRRPWRFPCSGNRHTKRLHDLLRLVGPQRGELLYLREQAAQYQHEKRNYKAMIDRLNGKCKDLQKDVDELNELLGQLDATTQARMVEGSVLGFL